MIAEFAIRSSFSHVELIVLVLYSLLASSTAPNRDSADSCFQECVSRRCPPYDPTPVTLTFVGPNSVSICVGYPPGASPSGTGKPYDLYPQLAFTVINAPQGLALIWDRPSDASPIPGLGAPSGPSPSSVPGQNWAINSPAVLSGDEADIYISNLNGLAGLSSTSTTGIYGAGNNGGLPCFALVPHPTVTVDPVTGNFSGNCCQRLRFSVSPADAGTVYLTGYKDVTVCYEDWATCTIL